MVDLTSGSFRLTSQLRQQLLKSGEVASKLTERLSSGQRINQASDDPAGLILSSQIRADARTLSRGVKNLNDAISVTSVAANSLNILSSITTRLSEIATQSASGTYSSDQRNAMQAEVDALVEEFNRTVSTTNFNSVNPLSSSFYAQGGVGIQNTMLVDTAGQYNPLIQIDTNTTGMGPFSQMGSSISTPYAFASVAGLVNNDSHNDLLITSVDNDATMIFLGNGDGTFLAPITHSGTFSANDAELGDLNGDGKLDLVTTRYVTGGGQLGISLGNGDGTFQVNKSYSDSGFNGAIMLDLLDLTGDGKLDAVIRNELTNKFEVIVGNGDGTFQAARSYVTATTNGFVNEGQFVDINGDDIRDFIVVFNNGTFGAGMVLYGNSDGSFAAPTTVTAMGNRLYHSVGTGDFDKDGDIDLVASHNGGPIYFLGNGNGTFNAGVTLSYPSLIDTYQTQTVDFSNDGNLDYILYEFGGSRIFFMLGNGDGTFTAMQSFNTGLPSQEGFQAIADFNGDGVDEYVVTDRTNHLARIFQMTTSTTTTTYSSADPLELESINVLTQSFATTSLEILNRTYEQVEYRIGQVAASESQLTVFMNSVQTMEKNYDLAYARITEVDIADDTANLVRQQIILQATTALYAQANQSADIVLSLLQ